MNSAFLTSTLLPVPHAFSTREGGVSEGPFATLNVGLQVGDDAKNVLENLGRVARQAEVPPDALHTVVQVHGDRVVEAPVPSSAEADALWTEHPGHAVGVRTADCVPILLVDPVGRRVAAVHSGWKGTSLRVAARAVEALERRGSRPGDLRVAIGPSIRRCCYTVSPELAVRFLSEFGEGVAIQEGGQFRLDLVRAVCAALLGHGVNPSHLDVLPYCTSCSSRGFFSHRRDKGATGRHLSFAVCRF